MTLINPIELFWFYSCFLFIGIVYPVMHSFLMTLNVIKLFYWIFSGFALFPFYQNRVSFDGFFMTLLYRIELSMIMFVLSFYQNPIPLCRFFFDDFLCHWFFLMNYSRFVGVSFYQNYVSFDEFFFNDF
jgi:hypothetical protein